MPPPLLASRHGKARVRVAKVTRKPRHTIREYTVQVELHGGTDASFTHGDNSKVIATDTCKNHVYMLAKTHPMKSPESFALALGKRFLELYSHIDAAEVKVVQRGWERFSRGDVPHVHGFVDGGAEKVCSARVARGGIRLSSGLRKVSVLKTTQSGWAHFFRDTYTTLPDTDERLLATTVDADWTYGARSYNELLALNYVDIHNRARDAMMDAFFGPPQRGVFSRGVQETLYKMACATIDAVKEVASVTLSLPNLHFLPCDIPVFRKNGLKFEDDVYVPSDEPHGIITATVGRDEVVGRRRARL